MSADVFPLFDRSALPTTPWRRASGDVGTECRLTAREIALSIWEGRDGGGYSFTWERFFQDPTVLERHHAEWGAYAKDLTALLAARVQR
jgi:hypothetical protein